MNLKEALETAKYRLQYCANLYGAKWKQEEPFLKACVKALEEKKHFRERSPRERRPAEGAVVVAQIKISKDGIVMKPSETVLAVFDPDNGWKLADRQDEEFEILSWRYIPEWSAKVDEKNDSEDSVQDV